MKVIIWTSSRTKHNRSRTRASVYQSRLLSTCQPPWTPTMSVIYKSNFPDVEIPQRSIFTHLLPVDGPYPDSLPAFTDAPTGKTITRGELRTNALKFAAGLTGENQVLAARGGPKLARGDVVAIFRYVLVLFHPASCLLETWQEVKNSFSINLFSLLPDRAPCILTDLSS